MKLLATVPFSVAALFLVGCSGTTEQPPDTVGPVPVATVVDTLLPVVADTLVVIGSPGPPDVPASIVVPAPPSSSVATWNHGLPRVHATIDNSTQPNHRPMPARYQKFCRQRGDPPLWRDRPVR